jgi:hypothetical protein
MSNPSLCVTQIKTASVVFKDASGNVIAAGGPVVWSVAPVGAIGFGTASAQSIPATGGNVPGTTVTLTATEPTSGFAVSQLVDIKAVQFLVTQGLITIV